MSEPAEGPGTPLLRRHQVGSGADYRRVVGAHRAPGTGGGPPRGYLFTVALLAGTASMPILAAFSAGSATVGNSALPDSSTPFIPTPSVGPVVVPLPVGTQPPVLPTRAATSPPPRAPLRPAAPALPVDTDLGSQRRSLPGTPVPRPTRATPTGSPRPSPIPTPSPSASNPATSDPTPSPTAEPTSTCTNPATGPSPTASPDPAPTTSPDGSPSPTSPPPEEPPVPTLRPTPDPDPSPSAAGQVRT
ncbi:hypothetical protein [Micromonospora sp. NPDC005806]|uniref:hypothetical protein n=1 Tax=Micromonospora sp. NPDC005806 TaxID=3364234 RepID=UPI00368D8434